MTDLTDQRQQYAAPSDQSAAGAVSSRDLSELARAGLVVLGQPGMQVNFEVHHIIDHPGYLYNLLQQRKNAIDNGPIDASADDTDSVGDTQAIDEGQEIAEEHAGAEATEHEGDENDGEVVVLPEGNLFVETLTSGANGIGLVIGTRAGTGEAALYRAETSAPITSSRNVFRGLARPNPSFTHEASNIFEAVIGIDEPAARRVSFQQSVLIRDLLASISGFAAHVVQAPMVFAQLPAQLPTRGKGADQEVRPRDRADIPSYSASLALRFAIALPHSSSATRIALAEQIVDYCEKEGLSLWLADTRLGYGTGNWYQIRSLDSLRVGHTARQQQSARDQSIRVCLPVTFVGPARTGSTFAVLDFLRALPFVGVIACSNTTLDDIAFIHLQLSLHGATLGNLVEANAALANVDLGRGSPSDVLLRVFAVLGYSVEQVPSSAIRAGAAARMWDYETLVGSLFPVVPSDRRRMAVWFSWRSNGADDGLSGPLSSLYSAFVELGLLRVEGKRAFVQDSAPLLEYLVCRQVSGQLLRGQGKLSLPKDIVDKLYGGDDREAPASRFCATLEAVWKDQARSISSVSELTVAWHESWLGRRSRGV